ncbi:MAG: hypothetical protein JKX80_00910 [Candidatus Pacebacteria bacterium]|nr:hypothetical protein [Candidatus Paceibacterota bacterium]
MKDKLVSVTLGIRHRRTFGIPEISGRVIDNIINDKDSPFRNKGSWGGVSTAPIFDGAEQKGRILFSEDGSNSLTLDTDSVILALKANNVEVAFKKIKETYIPYLEKNVFKKFGIEYISRIGIVFLFTEEDATKANALLNKFTHGVFTAPDTLSLRFSEKDTALDSITKKDILDYTNSIVTLQREKGGELISKFDFQFYYAPEITDIADVDIDMFLTIAQQKVKENFFEWFSEEENGA